MYKNNFRIKIEKLYYNYGKFCASYPILILFGVICVIIISCYPLSSASFHSNTPFHQKKVLLTEASNLYMHDKRFIGYVQQVIIQNYAVVQDLTNDNPMEILYDSLSQCFSIVNTLKKKEAYLESCFETGDIIDNDKLFNVFPTYSCLLLSPAQLWKGDLVHFWADGNILKTINSQKSFIKDMMFGLPWKKTGLSNIFNKKEFHSINYAITFLLKKYDKNLLEEFYQSLRMKYNISIHEPSDAGEEILYKDSKFLSTHLPLLITYMVLMLYVYFSVRKIEMVKSKVGLAFSACFTVAASLYMSLGICIYIGIVVPTLPGNEIFPYLVVIIGLENTLVVTKSVVATPVDLPVKHRIAQGLEKEGWAITKNLFSEILILSLGIFTFNPAIQEFFLLALIGLSTDFFLQITFFVTVLSIDMRRMELSDIRDSYHNQLLKSLSRGEDIDSHLGKYSRESFIIYLFEWIKEQLTSIKGYCFTRTNKDVVPTMKGHKRKASDINTAAFIQSDGRVPVYIPRRLIFLYFWASNRIFQRLVMIVAAIWVLFIILYSTNLVDSASLKNLTSLPIEPDVKLDLMDDWKLLAMHHWPRLAKLYSINITDRKLFVLPSWTLMNKIVIHHQGSMNKDKFTRDNTLLSIVGTNDLLMQIPSSLRGWADLGLTFKMILASIVGVGIVLMTTALLMALFQALQSISGDNREPVLRILPLRIESNFSVPPGAHCTCYGPLLFAAGIKIINRDRVDFLIRYWSLETGTLLGETCRRGIWDMAFVANKWIVLGFDKGTLELWSVRANCEDSMVEVDKICLSKGGIVKLCYWKEEFFFASTIEGWMIMVTIKNNKMSLCNSLKIFSDPVRDFHVSNENIIVACSNKCIKILHLPQFTIGESVTLIAEPILASHFVETLLVVSNGSQEINLIDIKLNKVHKWKWQAPIHWIRCCPGESKKCVTTVVTFDSGGAISLWVKTKKSPIRQILIAPPSSFNPNPITLTKHSLIFADNGYLRLFNVYLNKYERSIQILGSRLVEINDVAIAANQWIICLNNQKEFIVLPISIIK